MGGSWGDGREGEDRRKRGKEAGMMEAWGGGCRFG